MPTANRITLIGTVSREPEFAIAAGAEVCNFCVVINRKYKSKNEYKMETSYVDCQSWGSVAAWLKEKELNTGRTLYIEGRVKQRKWVDKVTDQNKSNLIVVAERVQYL